MPPSTMHYSLILDDGHSIRYTDVGNPAKPLFLFVIGSSGIGSLYSRLATELSIDFYCVYYDKRGFVPRSTDTGLDEKRENPFVSVEQHANDAAFLIKHLSPSQPAYVFGTSTGGTAVLDLAMRYPELVHTAVLHEPITFSVLHPKEFRNEMMNVYREMTSMSDPFGGYAVFSEYMFNPLTAPRGKLKLQKTPSSPKAFEIHNSRQGLREASAMLDYQVDVLKARKISEKLVIVEGSESTEWRASQPCKALAHILGEKRIWRIPGDHMSFASRKHVVACSRELRRVLREEGRLTSSSQELKSRI